MHESGEIKFSYEVHTIKEALRGDHFSLALKSVVIQDTFELALDRRTKIRSAISHFVLNNHN